jgi:hypothetical protein
MRNTYTAEKVEVKAEIKGTAVDIPVAGRPFMIANTGAQPLYINPAETATAGNGFLIPAGTVLPIKMAVRGNLSAISNSTGTSVAVLYFDV